MKKSSLSVFVCVITTVIMSSCSLEEVRNIESYSRTNSNTISNSEQSNSNSLLYPFSNFYSSTSIKKDSSLNSLDDSENSPISPSFVMDQDLKVAKKTKIGNFSFQDGCIYNGYLFAFSNNGTCYIYDCESFDLVQKSYLPCYKEMIPHSNTVTFGNKLSEEDEFPLLYSNIYNNYPTDPESYGLCYVYDIRRKDLEFSFSLVQTIKIGFIENKSLWYNNSDNLSPFGNFCVCDNKLIVYVNIFDSFITRFFVFDLPTVKRLNNVQSIILMPENIVSVFDLPLFKYIQGCAFNSGCLFSLEGFGSVEYPGFLRVINLYNKNYCSYDLNDIIGAFEPEFVSFYNNSLMIMENSGWIFEFEFIIS